jgi:hypothetical protein
MANYRRAWPPGSDSASLIKKEGFRENLESRIPGLAALGQMGLEIKREGSATA